MRIHGFFTALVWTAAASVLSAAAPSVFPEKKPELDLGQRLSDKPLPRGYAQYRFGMSRDEVLAEVRRDSSLRAYDADFIEGFERENWTVLVAVGPPFLDAVYFQFHDLKLYGVTLVFNRTLYGYFEIVKSLTRKYQWPNLLGQDASIWQDAATRIQLEQNLNLKYLDLAGFAKVKKDFDPAILRRKIDKQTALDKL